MGTGQRKMKHKSLSILSSIVLFAMVASFAFAEKNVLKSMEREFQAIVQSVKPAVVEVVASFTVPERQADAGIFPLDTDVSRPFAEDS